MDKKGAEKYYLIISLILGLIIVAMSLYFIFHEYFTQEDIDWEACRQSVVLRAQGVNNLVKLVQEEFPFKCKTEVLEIDLEDETEATELIADKMVQCWYIYGEGEYKLYPENIGGRTYSCFVCSRIKFTESVGKLPLALYLSENKISDGRAYQDYLYDIKESSNIMKGWAGDKFLEKLIFPQVIDPANGDLFIVFYNRKENFIPFFKDNTRYGTVVVQQGTLSNLECDFETIPA